ncbi:hypothetical protein Lal_00012779 [Lupinus albus]|nr:hypothetical protein Lal_00012779 [Lupinus albus]
MISCQEGEHDESSEVNSSYSSSNSDNSPMHDILYGAYYEMHEELKKLAKNYMDKKRLILEHEKKIYELQFFIDELKLENETLDLIYANSSCNFTTKLSETSTCEKCKVLNAENYILKNKFAKLTYSSHNLDNLLAASRSVGNLSGLDYMHAKKSKSSMNQTKRKQREVKEWTRIRQSKLEDMYNSTNNKIEVAVLRNGAYCQILACARRPRPSERISVLKLENYGSLAQARNGSLEREEACWDCEILA